MLIASQVAAKQGDARRHTARSSIALARVTREMTAATSCERQGCCLRATPERAHNCGLRSCTIAIDLRFANLEHLECSL